MKFLTRTITVLVIINLIMINFAPAQEAPAEPPRLDSRGASIPSQNPEPMEPTPPLESPPIPMPTPLRTFTISGMTGIAGVMMTGLPGIPVTDPRGYYSATVPYSFSGTVMPVKKGFTFEPASMVYRKIIKNQDNQNYLAKIITFIISGNVGSSGVMMTGLPDNPVTDKYGYYSIEVPYGWAGTVRPMKDGINFEPPEKHYMKLMSDQTNQDYIAKKLSPPVMFGRTGGREILIIPAVDIKAEDLTAVTEDLQVMTHIFDEKFKEPQEIQGVFVDFGDFFGRDSRKTEAIYIQGYGALFLMEVNFAFSPEPKTEEKQTEKTEEVDPIWQRTRQKIFAPPGFNGREFETEQKYSANKIEQIKQELVRTLKHTTNIRHLQPDEMIILTVIGKARPTGGMYQYNFSRSRTPRTTRTRTSRSRGRSSSRTESGMYGMGGGMGGMGGMGGGMGGMGGSMGGSGYSVSGGMMMGGGMMGGMGENMEDYGETGSAPATVLTIRVKKSDVDAFARGFRKFEEFQKNVEIFTY